MYKDMHCSKNKIVLAAQCADLEVPDASCKDAVCERMILAYLLLCMYCRTTRFAMEIEIEIENKKDERKTH